MVILCNLSGIKGYYLPTYLPYCALTGGDKHNIHYVTAAEECFCGQLIITNSVHL